MCVSAASVGILGDDRDPNKHQHTHAHGTPHLQHHKQVYEAWDAWVGPWVCRRFVTLRSVFVKFGQYVGGRSDMVPPAWAAALSLLQVRRVVDLVW